MTLREHLLTILAEEALEVAHRATKALRFGPTEIQAGQTQTNEQRIAEKIMDLLAVAGMICLEGISILPYWILKDKRLKVERYLELSKQEGTLGDG